MKKASWKKSASALRHVFHDLKVEGSVRDESPIVHYKFGGIWHKKYGYYMIFSGRTQNVLATVKPVADKVVIRYRKNAVYSEILKSYQYKIPTIHVPSDTLANHRGYARDKLLGRIKVAMMPNVEAAGHTENYTVTISIVPGEMVYDIRVLLQPCTGWEEMARMFNSVIKFIQQGTGYMPAEFADYMIQQYIARLVDGESKAIPFQYHAGMTGTDNYDRVVTYQQLVSLRDKISYERRRRRMSSPQYTPFTYGGF